jgi:hypothetical protein
MSLPLVGRLSFKRECRTSRSRYDTKMIVILDFTRPSASFNVRITPPQPPLKLRGGEGGVILKGIVLMTIISL